MRYVDVGILTLKSSKNEYDLSFYGYVTMSEVIMNKTSTLPNRIKRLN